MVRHIILWNLIKELDPEEKQKAAQKIKEGLEGLYGIISGLDRIEVVIDGLPTGNADLMLNSEFADAEALKNYQVHPDHIRVSDFVKQVTCNRMCFDYEK